MDMMSTGYDPFEQLLALESKYEQLLQKQEQIINVINNQSQIIQSQSKFIADFDGRLTNLESQFEEIRDHHNAIIESVDQCIALLNGDRNEK